MVVAAERMADRGVELAVLAAVIAGVQTMAAALPHGAPNPQRPRDPPIGKGRTRDGDRAG
jgi:hypothetical protein